MSSDCINAYGQQIKNVAEPTTSSDAATMNYVDIKIQELCAVLCAMIQSYHNNTP